MGLVLDSLSYTKWLNMPASMTTRISLLEPQFDCPQTLTIHFTKCLQCMFSRQDLLKRILNLYCDFLMRKNYQMTRVKRKPEFGILFLPEAKRTYQEEAVRLS